MKIIAVEEHFHTEKFISHLHSRKDIPRRDTIIKDGEIIERDWWSPTDYFGINAVEQAKGGDLGELRLKDMDDAGIDVQVLSFVYPGFGLLEASDSTSLAKDINDELSEAIKYYPERFAGFATVAPQDPKAAANELERAVKKLGLKGAMVTGHTRGEYLDDQKYWGIFEIAEKLEVPIYIHPGVPPPDMIKPYLDYPGLALAMWGFGADAGLHAMRLICSGVFDRYPGLKIILGHLGEAIPFWLWRMSGKQPLNNCQKSPSQYFKDNFYVTTSGVNWQLVLQFVLLALGADSIMFATDYPAGRPGLMKQAVSFIESTPISDGDKERICHLNAEKLFRL